MENIASQNKFKLSTSNSYKSTADLLSKPALIPKVNFNLPFDSNVFLKLLDKSGKIVRIILNGEFLRSGQHSNEIALNDLEPGDYFCVMESGDSKEVRAIRVSESNI
ncbi:MAG: hypothetical protein KDC73_12105 [Ignavibacteriae bacterium]|nr:hypothetical protein [Ignavibacteriota bacterium]MCB9243418.1 hypothetical protein [Ignavibacteriales bacterium]